MRNKMITGAIIAAVLLSGMVLFWYFTPSEISIVSINAPKEIVIGQLDELIINLQNNASKDVNVTINVKNAFVDEKGESLKGFTILAYGNLSNMSNYISPNAVDRPQKEVLLKPGSNIIVVSIGYQVAGAQKIEVEVHQQGKLADSRTIELNVLKPTIKLFLQDHEGINGTNEIYSVYGYLQIEGKGYASGVAVNISVINELTNTTVKTVTRRYSSGIEGPLITWEHSNVNEDPVTGARTTVSTKTNAPIVVIELSKDEPSTEKYIMSPIAVKGKIGDIYRVVVTATWVDQVVSSEMRIPSPPPTSESV